MNFTQAPYFKEIAKGPSNGQAFWSMTSDGVRVRIAHWASTEKKGTLLLFPGRTEYIEKYGPTAQAFTQCGYDVVTIDWRGQGLADRLTDDPNMGHVDDFLDYQKDVAKLLDFAGEFKLPEPLHLLGHSMGGCIGLRSLEQGAPIASAAFSAPMWGIKFSPVLKPLAPLIASAGSFFGLGESYAPSTSGAAYCLEADFEGNTLTTDREMWDFMVNQLRAEPKLCLGGPSMKWLHLALRECAALAQCPAPTTPTLTYIGADEAIVDNDAIFAQMSNWENGKTIVVPDAQHEVLMHDVETRTQIMADICAFFGRHTEAPNTPILKRA